MNGLVELFSRMWKRILVDSGQTPASRSAGIVQASDAKTKPALNIKRLSIFLVIPLLALAVRDYLLSPLMVVFGALIIVRLDFQARQKRSRR